MEVMEIASEPCHIDVGCTSRCRIYRCHLDVGCCCKWHIHRQPSLMLFANTTTIINEVERGPSELRTMEKVDFHRGQILYGDFASQSLVHKAHRPYPLAMNVLNIEAITRDPDSPVLIPASLATTATKTTSGTCCSSSPPCLSSFSLSSSPYTTASSAASCYVSASSFAFSSSSFCSQQNGAEVVQTEKENEEEELAVELPGWDGVSEHEKVGEWAQFVVYRIHLRQNSKEREEAVDDRRICDRRDHGSFLVVYFDCSKYKATEAGREDYPCAGSSGNNSGDGSGGDRSSSSSSSSGDGSSCGDGSRSGNEGSSSAGSSSNSSSSGISDSSRSCCSSGGSSSAVSDELCNDCSCESCWRKVHAPDAEYVACNACKRPHRLYVQVDMHATAAPRRSSRQRQQTEEEGGECQENEVVGKCQENELASAEEGGDAEETIAKSTATGDDESPPPLHSDESRAVRTADDGTERKTFQCKLTEWLDFVLLEGPCEVVVRAGQESCHETAERVGDETAAATADGVVVTVCFIR
eukprot:GHVS01085085.1.p1 GENE.GHVS01085085.1~~GHVS01085085.1.p1  ORF type:complete len:526 (-),score=178.65 GHVS01085085.1:1170-2747(-)